MYICITAYLYFLFIISVSQYVEHSELLAVIVKAKDIKRNLYLKLIHCKKLMRDLLRDFEVSGETGTSS